MPTPKLDYAIGRFATESKVGTNDELRIMFEGDIMVVVEQFFTTPDPMPDLYGTVFMQPVYEEDQTRLQFGRVVYDPEGVADPTVELAYEISAIPTEYRVLDPRFDEDRPYYPQREEENTEDEVPVDISDERAVEGPETPAELTGEAGGGEDES
jgi:hypothetical protein